MNKINKQKKVNLFQYNTNFTKKTLKKILYLIHIYLVALAH